MYSTGTKTAFVIFALLIGFLIFQQFKINDFRNGATNDNKYSYLDHQGDKFEQYERAGYNPNVDHGANVNNPQVTNVNNVNKTLTHRVTDLQSQREALKEQITALKEENTNLIKENKEREVTFKRIEAENIALKAELNTLKKQNVKPTAAETKEIAEETLLGLMLGDIHTETFQVKGIKQGL